MDFTHRLQWRRATGLRLLAASLVGLTCANLNRCFAAEAPPSHPSVLEGAAALRQPVSFTETKIPLGELVQKVGRETGVSLTAAADVADEPVAVVVKAMPARELLEQLAGLLEYRWTRQGREGAWRYEIDQDLAARQREAALRQAQMEAVEKRLRERLASHLQLATMPEEQFQRVLEEARKYQEEQQRLSPEQRQARLQSPEERAREQRSQDALQLWTPANRALTRLVGRMTPAQWAALREEGWIDFCTDPQPGEQRLPLEAENAFRARQTEPLPPQGPAGVDARIQEAQRQADQKAREDWASASGFRVTVRFDADRFASGGGLWLTASAFPLCSSQPIPPSPMESDGWRRLFLYAGPEDLVQQQAQAAELTPERQAKLAQHPVLGIKKSFQPAIKPRRKPFGPGTIPLRLQELLPELARTYGVQFLSDAYWTSSPRVLDLASSGEPAALFWLLDRLAGPTHRWDHEANIIRLRSRTWFFDRPREVPLRLVRHWKEVGERQGPLPLEEYVQMATALTDAQLETLDEVAEQAELPFGSLDAGGAQFGRHALRLYGSLSPAQQQVLWRGGAIPVTEMKPAQRALFLAGVKELVRRWYQPVPTDLGRWGEGSFALGSSRLVRTVLDEGGSVYLQPVTPAAAGGRTAPAAAGGKPHVPEEIGTPVAAPAARVDQLHFEFRYGAGLKKSVDLVVAPLSISAGRG